MHDVTKFLLSYSLDSLLAELEKKNAVTSRWEPGDQQYEGMKMYLLKEKREHIRTAMWSSVVKRHYFFANEGKVCRLVNIVFSKYFVICYYCLQMDKK